MQQKKILFIFRQAPYGTAHAQEALDAVLLAGSYLMIVSVLFLDDGVFLLKKYQDAAVILRKAINKTFPVLTVYEIENVFADELSLQQRGLNNDSFLMPVKILSTEATASLLSQQDVILSF